MCKRRQGSVVGGGKDDVVGAGKTLGESLSSRSARTDKEVEGGHRGVRGWRPSPSPWGRS